MSDLREIVTKLSDTGLNNDEICGFVDLVKLMKRSSYEHGLRGEERSASVRDRFGVVSRNLVNAKEAGRDVLEEVEKEKDWVSDWGRI